MDLDAFANKVLADLPKATRDELCGLDESDLISCHFGLGMWIRNNYNLWEMQVVSNDGAVMHPDDISQEIIERMWQKLQR
jgi:hypothetical protein